MDIILNIPDLHMWFSMLLIVAAMAGYASDRVPMELTSICIIAILLLFFHFLPLVNKETGWEIITTAKLLAGFANPALISVMSLLVIGQAVVQTGALNEIASIILRIGKYNEYLSIFITLFFVMVVSAILNNTPVVVIFIPIMAALAKSINRSVSKVMIPLSFVSILGGMMTLIGSSTNLLVSGILSEMGLKPLEFFDFTLPGMLMASVGFLYVFLILPKILPDRASFTKSFTDTAGDEEERKFIAQIDIDYSSDFVGKKLEDGNLESYPEIGVRMIQRGEHAFLPPFDEEMTIRPKDIMIISALKKDLSSLISQNPDTIGKRLQKLGSGKKQEKSDDDSELHEYISMAEIVVSPNSKVVGKNLERIAFHTKYDCIVLGIQRQSRKIRSKLTEIQLAPGDVLLVMGKRDHIMALHDSKDFLLMEWSTEDIHADKKAALTAVIFAVVVGVAALGIIPITVSSFAGVAAILLTGCLNFRQAGRALNMKIILMIAASLALGLSLQETGGASYIAHLLIEIMHGASALAIMSALFFLMMVITNILSNNAAAVLFTPIAVNLASQLNVDPLMFIFAVIFACNCSFVTPIGYQTNLMVMGPGRHKFVDFIRSGIPLALIIWITYCIYAYLHFILEIRFLFW